MIGEICSPSLCVCSKYRIESPEAVSKQEILPAKLAAGSDALKWRGSQLIQTNLPSGDTTGTDGLPERI